MLAADGLALPGAVVRFQGVSLGATVRDSLVVTDSLGIARTAVTAGFTAARQTIRATTPVRIGPATVPDTALFSLNASVDVPANLSPSGGGQQDTVAHTLVRPLSVHVTDRFSNPIANAVIVWRRFGNGRPGVDTSRTSETGDASTTFTLGTVSGRDSVRADIVGSSLGTTFLETALPGPSAELVIVSGDAQSDTIGTSLAPLVVKVRDAFGNGVPNVPVGWQVAVGTGVLERSFSISDANGIASVRYTLGTIAQAERVMATESIRSEQFSFMVLRGAPSRIIVIQGDGQSVPNGQPVPVMPAVRLTDRGGNGLPGVLVSVAAATAGDAVAPTSGATNSLGNFLVSSWTLGGSTGFHTLIFSSAAVASLQLQVRVTP